MAEAHRLSVIMFTDVVGYTARMEADETGTLALLEELNDFLRAQIEGNGGKIWKFIGDAVLAEFPAALDAVTCALAIQRGLTERNAGATPERRLDLRIALNAGDVCEKDGDIFGDTVNVASRLHSAAPPGGICVSRVIRETVRRTTPLKVRFLGKRTFKGLGEPLGVYLLTPPETGKDGARRADRRALPPGVRLGIWVSLLVLAVLVPAVALLLRRGISTFEGKSGTPVRHAIAAEATWKDSVAVLPFKNLSPEPRQDYFCDGVTEQIITCLSQIPDLKVIARTSVMAYKKTDKDVRAIADELGVANVLEGSVRKSGDRIRISAQLVRADDGTHLWARDYDRDSKDVFAVQDDVARSIAETLQLTVGGGPPMTAQDSRPASVDAYESYLRGRYQAENVYVVTHDEADYRKAMEYARSAVEIDPKYALGYCGLAMICEDRLDITNDPSVREQEFEYLRKAYQLDPHSALAASGYGLNLVRRGKVEEGSAICMRAVGLHPNDSIAWLCLGNVLNSLGLFEDAERALKRSTELDPRNYWAFDDLGSALAGQGKAESALAAFARAYELQPNTPPTIASCAGACLLANRLEEADRYVHLLEGFKGYEAEARRWRSIYCACAGERERALSLAAPGDCALLCLLGLKDQAIAALSANTGPGRSGEDPRLSYLPLARQRFYDGLRGDPRFQRILEERRIAYEEARSKYGLAPMRTPDGRAK